MSRLALAGLVSVTLALACVGCGEVQPMPEVDLLVRVAAGKTRVHPGEGVALTVTRVWRTDHEPSPWDDAVLEPLVLRAAHVSRRAGGGRIEETRRYRAYVFGLEDVVVPEVVFASRPKGGGALSLARSAPLALRVSPVLDPKAPGPPEPPGKRPAGPVPPWLWGGVLLLLVAGFEFVAWRGRHTVRQARAARLGAAARTLEALRARAARTPADCRADLTAAVDAVRDHLAVAEGLPARAWTSEEIEHALRDPDASSWRLLAAGADRTKFADAPVRADELQAALTRALALVRAEPAEPRP